MSQKPKLSDEERKQRRKEAQRRYCEKHKERKRESGKRSYHKCKNSEKQIERRERTRNQRKEYHHAYYENHKDRQRANGIASRYGITIDDYDEMFRQQNGECAICGIDLNEIPSKSRHIDHCHTNGHVRGILCKACNTVLGLVKDDTDILQKAIAYLERSKHEQTDEMD